MSQQKHGTSLITNEATLRRRAWIEEALAGVRARVHERDLEFRPEPPRPRLHLVDNERSR